MVKVTLDTETFKALASPTRLLVMRSLGDRRKTVTELARDLEMNKATIHEHLQLLAAAGLVKKRDDEGRKWIYYELTWTGERILHPQETTTFNLLLGLSVAAAGGGVAMLGRTLGWWWEANRGSFAPEADTGPSGEGLRMLTNATTGPEDLGGPSVAASPPQEGSDAGSDGDGGTDGGGDGGTGGGAPPSESPAPAPAPEPTPDGGDVGGMTYDDAFDLDRNETYNVSLVEGAGDDDAAVGLESDAGFWDEDGVLGLALLGLAILSAVLAAVLHRALRPRAPSEPPADDDGEQDDPNTP